MKSIAKEYTKILRESSVVHLLKEIHVKIPNERLSPVFFYNSDRIAFFMEFVGKKTTEISFENPSPTVIL
jgi:hypothetical protein